MIKPDEPQQNRRDFLFGLGSWTGEVIGAGAMAGAAGDLMITAHNRSDIDDKTKAKLKVKLHKAPQIKLRHKRKLKKVLEKLNKEFNKITMNGCLLSGFEGASIGTIGTYHLLDLLVKIFDKKEDITMDDYPEIMEAAREAEKRRSFLKHFGSVAFSCFGISSLISRIFRNDTLNAEQLQREVNGQIARALKNLDAINLKKDLLTDPNFESLLFNLAICALLTSYIGISTMNIEDSSFKAYRDMHRLQTELIISKKIDSKQIKDFKNIMEYLPAKCRNDEQELRIRLYQPDTYNPDAACIKDYQVEAHFEDEALIIDKFKNLDERLQFKPEDNPEASIAKVNELLAETTHIGIELAA